MSITAPGPKQPFNMLEYLAKKSPNLYQCTQRLCEAQLRLMNATLACDMFLPPLEMRVGPNPYSETFTREPEGIHSEEKPSIDPATVFKTSSFCIEKGQLKTFDSCYEAQLRLILEMSAAANPHSETFSEAVFSPKTLATEPAMELSCEEKPPTDPAVVFKTSSFSIEKGRLKAFDPSKVPAKRLRSDASLKYTFGGEFNPHCRYTSFEAFNNKGTLSDLSEAAKVLAEKESSSKKRTYTIFES